HVFQKPHGIGTVQHSVIVSQAKGKNCSNGNFALNGDRFCFALADSQDGDLWRVDDRGEMTAADAALIRDREGAALQFLDGNLALPRFLCENMKLFRKL